MSVFNSHSYQKEKLPKEHNLSWANTSRGGRSCAPSEAEKDLCVNLMSRL